MFHFEQHQATVYLNSEQDADLMDSNIPWIQPEQFCPATDLWQRLWEIVEKGENGENGGSTQNAAQNSNTKGYAEHSAAELADLRRKKLERLNSVGINELSPLTRVAFGGVPISPMPRHEAGLPVWALPTRTRYLPGFDGLHDEILDYYRWIQQTPEEYIMRYEVVSRVQQVIAKEQLFPGSKVEIYGSFQTRLNLPTSDIDMVICDFENSNRNQQPYEALRIALIEAKIAEPLTLKVLMGASVPIVKMRDLLSDIKVDISFNVKTGIQSVSLIKTFIREYQVLPVLVLVLKQFLLQQNLNEVWTGGISSYGLILMVLCFLQNHPRGAQATSPENANLGLLLIEFFELYGKNYSYENCSIRVKSGGAFIPKQVMAKQMESRGQVPAFLSIEDPLTEWNDIGRSSYKALEMKEKFHYAFMVLSRAVAPQASYHNTGSILAKILNFDDDVVEYRRWVNKHWENKVPRIKIVEPSPPPPVQKSRNSSVGKQSFFPDEQSSIGVISDGESSILSEEELSPIRKDRKVEYRRSSDQVSTNKERRSNSDSSAKANYEENFPDISESKNAPSEKASSANYLSDKNNNEDMPRPRDDHDNRTRSKKEPKSEAESESDRKQRRERMNRMSAGSGILGMPRIMRSAFANLGEPDRVNARNVNINDASSTGSRGTDSFPASSGSKSKRPTKEFYKPRGLASQRQGNSDRESPTSNRRSGGSGMKQSDRRRSDQDSRKKKDGQSENRR